MSPEQLEKMIARLQNYGPNSIVVGGHRFEEGEGERYASQIEDNIEFYLSDMFDSEKSVIEDVSEVFGEVDDASWMFDDEENEEQNSIW
ncbi:MAG: hypothetical protein J5632_02885 [Bacteroidales bacterium]|nr:hypothetical protein [Bacteroidales bacterium]